MIGSVTKAKYKPTIGIECHVQLKTTTKLFEAVGNDARQAPPNTLVSHISFGLPGALPVLNQETVRLASKMAMALGTEPQRYSIFERKHYFYPDLPMGYQISQLHQPIVVGGEVNIEVEGQPRRIRINRVQIEADAGKNTHPDGKNYSLVDLNRAGTPLLEIVSEPDIRSPAEAKAYVRELYLLVRYADVSDADLYYGNMRFDVNVSVSQTDELGTRTETKNLNSFRAVEKAAEFEIGRQIELLEKNEAIVQETRGWDDAKQKTVSQRGKEEAHDYRYMPDPDLPPITIDDAYIAEVKASMSVMPAAWRNKLKAIGLDRDSIETLLDAEVEAGQVAYLDLLDINKNPEEAKQTANWQINFEIPLRRESKLTKFFDNQDRTKAYGETYRLAKEGKLSSSRAKDLLVALLDEQTMSADIEKYAEEKGYIQVSDEGEIAKIVEHVLNDNPKAAEDVKNGVEKATQFLVGQVMKASQGKANPGLAQELIKKQLGL